MAKTQRQYQKITVVLKPVVINEFYNLLPNLKLWLERRKKQIQFLDHEVARLHKIYKAKDLDQIKFIKESELFSESDLIISLGGDGTLLGICRKSKSSNTPIFGLNLGHLGFLTEFTKSEFFENLSQFFDGKYKIKRQSLYRVKVMTANKLRFQEVFLNDAVLNKKDIARMFTLKVDADSELIYNISGDGLIISSTLGSTAYSLAAGGPIVHPDVKALILTPICAHGLTHRPLVIPDEYKIQVKTLNQEDNVLLTLDGQVAIDVNSKDAILIEKDKKKYVYLVKNPERTFFQTLKEKFDYGRRDT
ncbi:MAG: NAD(+)/NADH kinase [Bacteriovoracaceae bacterium]